MAARPFRVATDVGGTFTDLLVFESDEETGEARVRSAKSDTTPGGYERGVFDVMEKAGIAAGSVNFLAHGTTVVINALTERTGVTVGLITTRDFATRWRLRAATGPTSSTCTTGSPSPSCRAGSAASCPVASITTATRCSPSTSRRCRGSSRTFGPKA